jgi:allophanate hydrolase
MIPGNDGPMWLVVVGAHLSGQPLNHQLTEVGGHLVMRTRTAPIYRMYALATNPPKPGLVRVDPDDPAGASILAEVWELPPASFAHFVDRVPAPLTIGRVQLEDGVQVAGFLCEPIAVIGATEITSFGSWRAYLEANG